MNNEKLTVDAEVVRKVYDENYEKSTRKALREIFGEDTFKPKSVKERITTLRSL